MMPLEKWLPIMRWLPNYERSWLRFDLVAGLTVWALLVPEAMAYADLAGMPPETGLYAGLGAIVGYAIFGTSRQLFVGPSSTVAILSLSTVAVIATGDNAVELTIALALLVGVLSIAAGLFRLGFISVFMSKPVLTGFMFGLGLTVAATVALLGVITIDLLPGLLIAVMMSFILVIYRASRPAIPSLERIPGGPYVDADRWRTKPTSGLVILRFEAPLIFASAEALEQRVDEAVDRSDGPVRAVVLDLESVSDIDTDGAGMLASVRESLDERDIAFLIARLNRAGRDALARADVYDKIGEENFFLSVRTAVRSVTGEQEDAADRLMQRYQIED